MPAPRAVEPERALQRQPADRPLILRVERVEHDAVALRLRLADGDLIRDLIVEPVLHLRTVGIGPLIVDQIRALIPELHVVGTGHVRRGGAIRVVELLERRRRAEAAIGEVGDRHARESRSRPVRPTGIASVRAPYGTCPPHLLVSCEMPASSRSRFVTGDAVVALENPLAVVPVPGRLGSDGANPIVARAQSSRHPARGSRRRSSDCCPRRPPASR